MVACSDVVARQQNQGSNPNTWGWTHIGFVLFRGHVWTAPYRQELFWRFGKRIRCGHVSGLFSRCITAGPDGVRGRDSKSWVRAVMHDVSDGMSRSRSLTDLPSHHMALSKAGTEERHWA